MVFSLRAILVCYLNSCCSHTHSHTQMHTHSHEAHVNTESTPPPDIFHKKTQMCNESEANSISPERLLEKLRGSENSLSPLEGRQALQIRRKKTKKYPQLSVFPFFSHSHTCTQRPSPQEFKRSDINSMSPARRGQRSTAQHSCSLSVSLLTHFPSWLPPSLLFKL